MPRPSPPRSPSRRPRRLAPRLMSDAAFVLMLIVSGLFSVLLVALLFVQLPTANKDVVVALAGLLGTSFATIVGFFFGSSRGSQAKDQTISSLTARP